ncbi:hypothetical protein KKB69_01850 [Patescibacteria group bacterium]|nr:hypothetical protein [Patescibacteria group bacterium]
MIERIKPLIENSGSFGLLTDQNPEDHEFLAKEALKKTISQKFLPVLDLPRPHTELLEKWSAIIKPVQEIEFPKKTLLKLPKSKYGIKEVAYKEDGENLALVITSDNGLISSNDISFETLLPETETVFCFFENQAKLEKFQGMLQLPDNEKIVFLSPNRRTQTEKVFEIIKIFNPDILEDAGISSLLYAALVSETNNFSEKNTKEVLSLGSLLLENTIQHEIISEILEKEKSDISPQLFGRALARTFIDPLLNISWSFLNSRDLQKTNSSSISLKSLYKITQKISKIITSQNLHILIWQSIDGIQALVAAGKGRNESFLLPFAEKMNAAPQSRFFTVGPFKNFSEAEIYLRDALKT